LEELGRPQPQQMPAQLAAPNSPTIQLAKAIDKIDIDSEMKDIYDADDKGS